MVVLITDKINVKANYQTLRGHSVVNTEWHGMHIHPPIHMLKSYLQYNGIRKCDFLEVLGLEGRILMMRLVPLYKEIRELATPCSPQKGHREMSTNQYEGFHWNWPTP